MKKQFLQKLGFSPKENSNNVYKKTFKDNYILEVDFDKNIFDFGGKILVGKNKIQNIVKPEDWVVFECVNRLLEKGYKPNDIILENTWKTGHKTSGRIDILVKKDGKSFLMIECKTWGKEFEKEFKNMKKDGGQLFTYFQQDKDAEYILLYTSNIELGEKFDLKKDYKNEILKIEEVYRETSNVADFYERWNKETKQNGVFEDWIDAYRFESRALTYNLLEDIKEEDSSYIFNRFLEILRHNTVSDKPNAFNKMFTLFLCKIYDELEKKGTPRELEFQWIEGKDDNISFQKRLTDLYKKGMEEFLSKQVTDFSDDDFEKQFGTHIDDEEIKNKLIRQITKLRLQKNNEFAIKEVFDDESFNENAKVLKEIVELLQKYKFRYTKKQPFLGEFFELLLTTGLKQEAGQFFTPVPIARFICKSIPIEKIIDKKLDSGENNDILPAMIDYAAGSGHFIIESMEEIQNIINSKDLGKYNFKIKEEFKKWKDYPYSWAGNYSYGIEKDYRLVRTSKVGCYLHGDGIATVIHGDGLDSFEKSKDYKGRLKIVDKDDKSQNEAFDLVLSNPPYSVSSFKGNLKKQQAEKDFKLFNSLTDNSSEIEALFIERTSQLLKEGGIAGIILPSSILSNTGIYTKAREIILKDFEIIAITELGSNTFMATGTNTVVLFLRKRNKFFSQNLENSIKKFFENKSDITLNGIENAVSKYVSEVWEGLTFEDYKTLLEKNPNEKIKNYEIFKDYENKIKSKDLIEEILETEKEKLFYFVLTYSQKVVLVKSGDGKIEKEFLGYKFSTAKGSEGIHPIFGGKQIDECTKLFDPNISDNPEKASTYIFDAFNNNFDRKIEEVFENHIFRIKLSDLIQINELEKGKFNKKISLNSKKKVKIESKWEIKKLGEICEIKIGGTPSRGNYDFWEKGDKLWLSISEINGGIILDTKEKINDLGVKKSNVKLIKKGTTLLSFKLSIGKTAIAGKDLYTNEAIAGLCLENEEKVLNRYLFSLFNSKFIDLEKGNFNTFGKSLNSSFLKNEVFIPLPPKDIQQKIVDEIGELEKIEEKNLEEIENSENEINNIIGNIEGNNIKLREILNIVRGASPRPIREYQTNDVNGVNWIKIGDVKSDSKYIEKTKEKITIEGAKKSREVRIGDFILSNSMSFGRPYIMKINGCIHDGWLLLNNFSKELNKDYLYNILCSNFVQEQFKNEASGGTSVDNLNIDKVENVKIPLPSLEKQKEIVQKIEILEEKIEKLKQENKNIPEKKKEILEKYL